MGALVVVDKIKDRNWSKYIHQWTMNYIRKYLNEPANARRISRTLGGCIKIRDIADTCYSNHVNISTNDIPYDEFLKQSILSSIGDLVDNKVPVLY
jgi:hypothetical protein